ncbi:LuxR family transcriptional regulator [Sphingomonas sp. C8-2]|nr:LuxR family transcriptional regulator [Sphingomonas sp. C8-2]
MNDLVQDFLKALGSISNQAALHRLLHGFAHSVGLPFFALITHEDLRVSRRGQVNIRCYPEPVSDRIIGQAFFRRDPIVRGSLFADGAFLWSRIGEIIQLDRQDRASFEFGSRYGLIEGVTVPCHRLGHAFGSCTFAGTASSARVEMLRPLLQVIGIFAFQRARRIVGQPDGPVRTLPRLNPRPRDCVVLAGRGQTNKQIARRLDLAPRTVDGYLKDARRILGAADRTEMVVAAVLDGQVGLDELHDRQSPSFALG